METEPQENLPNRRGLRKGMYLLPSLFTAANIGMGFYCVVATLHGFQAASAGDFARAAAYFDAASIAVGLAVLFDTLDGRIARITKTTTEFGVQLDSIADVLTFGIAPAVLIYAWSYGSVFGENTTAAKIGWFLSFMYVICGAFRLARFNVQSSRPRVLAEGSAKVDKKSFVGLPIPAAAGLLAALVHFQPQPLVSFAEELSAAYSSLVMMLVAGLSLLMVSTIRYTSFKSVGASRRSTNIAIVIVAATGMLVWLFSKYVLLIIALIYVLHGLVNRTGNLFRRRSPELKTNA